MMQLGMRDSIVIGGGGTFLLITIDCKILFDLGAVTSYRTGGVSMADFSSELSANKVFSFLGFFVSVFLILFYGPYS